jgi:hypothetical protein
MPHQLPFLANAFKKRDQLQLEEHYGINRRATFARIGFLYELTDE